MMSERRQTGLWTLAWSRFRRHRMALAGVVVLAAVVGAVVLGRRRTQAEEEAAVNAH